jgi:hypothetical protein
VLIALDFPAFERPAKATSATLLTGQACSFAALVSNVAREKSIGVLLSISGVNVAANWQMSVPEYARVSISRIKSEADARIDSIGIHVRPITTL